MNEEIQVTPGWRALFFGLCGSKDSDNPELTLEGAMGRHVHVNPAPKATHYSPWGDDCTISPCWPASGGLGCGYYGLNRPDYKPIGAVTAISLLVRPIIWAKVRALGRTILCEEGWKAESYLIDLLFWPCEDLEMQKPHPESRHLKIVYTGDGHYPFMVATDASSGPPMRALGTLDERLTDLCQVLGIKLVRRPLGLWLAEWEDMARTLDAALAKGLPEEGD